MVNSPLLANVLPAFAKEVQVLLVKHDEIELAAQVPNLVIVDLCRCNEDFCATFYTQPKPNGSYGAGHRNIDLDANDGMIILDAVNEKIVKIEVLYRDEIRYALQQHFHH